MDLGAFALLPQKLSLPLNCRETSQLGTLANSITGVEGQSRARFLLEVGLCVVSASLLVEDLEDTAPTLFSLINERLPVP